MRTRESGSPPPRSTTPRSGGSYPAFDPSRSSVSGRPRGRCSERMPTTSRRTYSRRARSFVLGSESREGAKGEKEEAQPASVTTTRRSGRSPWSRSQSARPLSGTDHAPDEQDAARRDVPDDEEERAVHAHGRRVQRRRGE